MSVYGSSRISAFLKDLQSGADSLDWVTIGDSTAGFNNVIGNSGGWSWGLVKTLDNMGMPKYASSLLPLGSATTDIFICQATSTESWFGFFSDIAGATGTLLRGSVSGPSQINSLCVPATTLRPCGVTGVDWAYVAGSTTNQSFNRLNNTCPQGDNNPALQTWCAAGTALRYGIVYATFDSGSGSIVPTVWNRTTASLVANKTINTNTGVKGIATDYVSFTMPNPSDELTFGWNYVGTATGPAGAIYDYVYRVQKGFSLQNIQNYGGAAVDPTAGTSLSAGVINAGSQFWQTYLGAIRARQIAAGGSGRVAVWMNGGINGPDDYTQWKAGMEGMITALQTAWAAAGFPDEDLAFVCSCSHPTNSGALAASETVVSATRVSARAWLTANPIPGVTYVDLGQMYTAAQIAANSWYDATTQAHLQLEGFVGITTLVVTRLLDYLPTPTDVKYLRLPFNTDGDPDSVPSSSSTMPWGILAANQESGRIFYRRIYGDWIQMALAGTATSSGLTVSAADKLLGSTTSSGPVVEVTCTSYGRALLDDTSTAAQRSTLGLVTASSNTIYVSTRSPATNTRTGLVAYDQSVPFATLQAALTASASGDVIVVEPGTYPDITAPITGFTGRTIHLLPGAVLNATFTASLGTPSTYAIFYVDSGKVLKITGSGTITSSGQYTAVLLVESGGSVSMSVDAVSTAGLSAPCLICQGGSSSIQATTVSSSTYDGVIFGGGTHYVTTRSVIAGDNAVASECADTSMRAHLVADYLESDTDVLNEEASVSGGEIYVTAGRIHAPGGYSAIAASCGTDTSWYVRCGSITGGVIGTRNPKFRISRAEDDRRRALGLAYFFGS